MYQIAMSFKIDVEQGIKFNSGIIHAKVKNETVIHSMMVPEKTARQKEIHFSYSNFFSV